MTDREDPHAPWRNPASPAPSEEPAEPADASAGQSDSPADAGAAGPADTGAGGPADAAGETGTVGPQPPPGAFGQPQGDPYAQQPDPYAQYPGDPYAQYPGGAPDPYLQYPAGQYQAGQYQPGAYQQYPYQQPPPSYSPTAQYPGAFPPAGPGGAGGRPKSGSGRLALVIGAAAVVVLLVLGGAVYGLVNWLGSANSGDTTTAAAPTTTDPGGTGVDACGYPGTGESAPITDKVVSGPLSFPVSAAPGWTAQTYTTYAQSARAAGIIYPIAGQQWQAGIEIGLTAFPTRVSGQDAVVRMVRCIAAGQGYKNTDPQVENQSQPQKLTVDGVSAVQITADIRVSKAGVTVQGDHLTVIVIDSVPQTYFLADTPIGDSALAQVVKDVVSKLKVSKDV
jgi:hypothetical protein